MDELPNKFLIFSSHLQLCTKCLGCRYLGIRLQVRRPELSLHLLCDPCSQSCITLIGCLSSHLAPGLGSSPLVSAPLRGSQRSEVSLIREAASLVPQSSRATLSTICLSMCMSWGTPWGSSATQTLPAAPTVTPPRPWGTSRASTTSATTLRRTSSWGETATHWFCTARRLSY